jgi:hypothetical protein
MFAGSALKYAGIGRGTILPDEQFIKFVSDSFNVIEIGMANELKKLIDFLNDEFVKEDFNKVNFPEVQKLAASCSTGCEIGDPGQIKALPEYKGFILRLSNCAYNQ